MTSPAQPLDWDELERRVATWEPLPDPVLCPSCGSPVRIEYVHHGALASASLDCTGCSSAVRLCRFPLKMEARPAPAAPVPGARLLLVVEDTFAIQGRGVLVVPDVDLGEQVQLEVRVALRRPEGDVLHAGALAQVPLGSFRSRPRHVLCFRTLSKQDLPRGTEVWLLGEDEVAPPTPR
ncbi:hypothetical protein D7X55_37670 [Corallococcus sp. AB049A]|uniref:hypothetical protein n=1 Tax=Corallococcus sp. AB049A TaxID=2316721 RepID=UPI000EC2A2FB|nr:hypothetical protein [Corallococcus sp. AB049A]RKI45245.1 hypothetical protein D7X55_37670 [Corallococcus sp. AB049A]